VTNNFTFFFFQDQKGARREVYKFFLQIIIFSRIPHNFISHGYFAETISRIYLKLKKKFLKYLRECLNYEQQCSGTRTVVKWVNMSGYSQILHFNAHFSCGLLLIYKLWYRVRLKENEKKKSLWKKPIKDYFFLPHKCLQRDIHLPISLKEILVIRSENKHFFMTTVLLLLKRVDFW
jgi:hypothetical protein